MMECNVCKSNDAKRDFIVTREDKWAYTDDRKAEPAHYYECNRCGAMYLENDMEYQEIYSDGSYYDIDGEGDALGFLNARFEKVINFPKGKSDNKDRVARVSDFVKKEGAVDYTILDIGSGTGVFMHEYFQQEKCSGVVSEPDPSSILHLQEIFKNIDIEVYSSFTEVSKKVEVVTLNRVLEHIYDPITFLKDCASVMEDDAILYLEVPDVLSYFKDGPNNQAFSYAHYHVHSPISLITIAEAAGFSMCQLDRCIEPSGKYTLYGFFRKLSTEE